MIIIALVSMVESTGVFFATSDLLKQDVNEDDLKRGYRAEGLAQIFGGIFNTFPYTTFSQNVGLLQLSGIKTRRPIFWAAGLLMGLGLLPKIGAIVTIIPISVLGGAMLVMFTMIAVQGINPIKTAIDFKKPLASNSIKIITKIVAKAVIKYLLSPKFLAVAVPPPIF